MARRDTTTQEITRTGTVLTGAAVTVDGDVIDAGRVALVVTNGSAADITVTVHATATQDGLPLTDLVATVAAGDTALLGPWPARTFGQPKGANESGGDDTGRVYIDYSATADVTSTAVRF